MRKRRGSTIGQRGACKAVARAPIYCGNLFAMLEKCLQEGSGCKPWLQDEIIDLLYGKK